MRVTVVTPPKPFISLERVKQHLKEDDNRSDGYIKDLVAAATAWIDGPRGWLGRSFGEQTLELRSDGFGSSLLQLPFGPAISVVSVKYLDADGDEQTVDPADYLLLADDRLALGREKSWPSSLGEREDVRIRWRAGFPTVTGAEGAVPVSTVPMDIQRAVLLMVGHWYRNREEVITGTIATQLPMAAEALLSTARSWAVPAWL